MRIEDLSKELFQARCLSPSEIDVPVESVMNGTEFLSFVRHIAMFLMLQDGKFSPKARKQTLALKQELHVKHFDRVSGEEFSRWQCVSPCPIIVRKVQD